MSNAKSWGAAEEKLLNTIESNTFKNLYATCATEAANNNKKCEKKEHKHLYKNRVVPKRFFRKGK